MRARTVFAVALSASLFLFGCDAQQSAEPTDTTDQASDAHEHGHSHDEAGPHGGHLVELGDEEYHLEWTHDDESGLVTVFVLDATAKELVPIAAESITITVKVEETAEYKLAAVDPSGEPPKASQFAVEDKLLITGLQMAGQGSETEASLTIEGKDYTGVFEHHAHGHGHAH